MFKKTFYCLVCSIFFLSSLSYAYGPGPDNKFARPFKPFTNPMDKEGDDFLNEMFNTWVMLGRRAKHFHVKEFKKIWESLSERQQSDLILYVSPYRVLPETLDGGDNLFHYAASTVISSTLPPDGPITGEIVDILCDKLKQMDLDPNEVHPLNTANIEYKTPTEFALEYGQYEIAKSLIACGAATNIVPNPSTKRTAQMLIASSGHLDLFDMVSDELDLEAADINGRTVLRYAYHGLHKSTGFTQENIDHNQIIAELHNRGGILNGGGCEYFEGTARTQSAPGDYVYIPYTGQERNTALEKRKDYMKTLSKQDLTKNHLYLVSPEDLKIQATQEAIQDCKNSGYKECRATSPIMLPRNWDFEKDNPGLSVFPNYSTAKVGSEELLVVFRSLSAKVSVVGLEPHGNEKNCFIRSYREGEKVH